MNLLSPLLVIYRLSRLLLLFLLGIGMLGVLMITHGRQWHITPRGMYLNQWWMGQLCRFVGVRITQYGHTHQQSAMYVANHVSFMDIPVLATTTPVRFLSKQSVRYWPVIGFLTASFGTVYIDRSKRSAVQPTLEKLVHVLHTPQPLAIFPESTTSYGESVLKFHSGLFQAAINAGTPVQPVAIRYLVDGKLDKTAAYVGSDNLLVTLIKLLGRRETHVHLAYCPLLDTNKHTRRQLADMSRESIQQMLDQSIPASAPD